MICEFQSHLFYFAVCLGSWMFLEGLFVVGQGWRVLLDELVAISDIEQQMWLCVALVVSLQEIIDSQPIVPPLETNHTPPIIPIRRPYLRLKPIKNLTIEARVPFPVKIPLINWQQTIHWVLIHFKFVN